MRPRFICLGVVVLLLGGCSTGEPKPSDSTDIAFDQQVAQVLGWADESSVISPEQRATLNEIAQAGEVTFEQYRTGHLAALDCMEDAGLTVSEPYTYNERGIEVFNADVTQPSGMDDDSFLALLNGCEDRHSYLIDYLYFNQPSSVDQWAQLIESHRADILACFTSQGAVFDEDVTWMEMETIREEIVLAQREIDKTVPPVDCFDVAGIIWPED